MKQKFSKFTDKKRLVQTPYGASPFPIFKDLFSNHLTINDSEYYIVHSKL